MKELLSPELSQFFIKFSILAPPILMALSKRQREAILLRDKKCCQFPVYSEKKGWKCCGSKTKPEVHHVSPQRWETDQGVSMEQRDQPENLITLCQKHHHEEIHPDMIECLRDYGRQKRAGVKRPDSFNQMFQERGTMSQRGEKYWDDSWDQALGYKAEENTLTQPTWEFPEKGRRGSRKK